MSTAPTKPVVLAVAFLVGSGLAGLAGSAENETADKPNAGETSGNQQDLLLKKQKDLADQEAKLELAKSKLDSLKNKVASQEKFIADLNSVIALKETGLPDRSPETGGESDGDGGKASLPAAFLAEVTPRIVVIEGNNGRGTGFLCESGGDVWVYTAAHVLSGNSTITVRDSKGRIYRDFDFLEAAEGVDLVRLKPRNADFEGLSLATKLERPEVGDLIVAVGNSLGAGSLSGEPGRILSVGDDMWEVDAEIIPGNSGGPVLSLESRKVIGIVTHLIISGNRSQNNPTGNTEVKRFAARLDKPWEWRKMPVSRFVKEWNHIEAMSNASAIAWASTYLMHTGPESLAQRDARYNATFRTDPKMVALAESILAKDRKNFQVQRVDGWLKRYRDASALQRNGLIDEGNQIIDRILGEIVIKENGPKVDDFSWFHRQMFEEELKWRKKLTEGVK